MYCISVRQQFEHQLSIFGIVCDFLTYARATDNDVRLLRFQMTDTQCASFGSSTHSDCRRMSAQRVHQTLKC